MATPSPEQFVELLAPPLRQAAAIARALEGRVANRPKSGEETAVKQALTVADTACQETLLVPLLEAFPDVRIEAEEDTASVHGFATEGDALVVVDPIDGTLHSYLDAEGPYAIMAGLVLASRYEAGLIALPREGLFLEAVRGTGAWVSRATGKRRAAEPIADGKRVLVSHGMPQSVRHALRDRGYEVAMGCGGAVGIAPLVRGVCAGLRYASNDLGVSVRGRISAAIARAAGAHVVGRDGEAFPEDEHTPAPILVSAAQERDARAILDVVAASGVAG
ncbi:MAG: hypothetical protein MJE66_11980 [Proteobacteria bacterium]|nr:hypothetical protein [Pseudomonadota bacterium]